MINCIIETSTDIRVDRRDIQIGMSLEESYFATVPMQEITPGRNRRAEGDFATVPMQAVYSTLSSRRIQEEEWYTSFEQAISGRAACVSQQLRRLSTTALKHTVPDTDPLPDTLNPVPGRAHRFWQAWKRTILLGCLGLGLFLAGFDLLGLLMMLR